MKKFKYVWLVFSTSAGKHLNAVIPDLIRNPGRYWTPAFAGVTNEEEVFYIYSSHPETTFPDENYQLPALNYGQKPFEKGFLARA